MRRELASIGITNPLRAWQALRNFVKTVWDPTRSDIRGGVNALLYGALRDVDPERIERFRSEAPKVAALCDEGYDPALDMRHLEALPDGTFGREYARFLRENGIDPLGDLLELPPPTNVVEYSFRRAYKLHDMLHIALGCDASILGEVRIVAFSLGQARESAIRAPALALVVLLLHLVLRRPAEFAEAIRLAAEWMRTGERCEPYSGFRMEDWLARPVEEARARVLAA